VPLTLFIGIAAIVAVSAMAGLLPKNMIGGLAVIMTLGFALAKIGRMVPVLKDIGGPAILCLMMPSVLVYFGVFEAHTLDTVHLLMKEANLLYFVIACLVVGSILGMNRTILIQGMVRMFVPLVVGTGAAIATGLLVGSLFGYSFTTPFSLLSCRLSAAVLGKGSCRCRWLIRRSSGKRLTSMWRSWRRLRWWGTFSPLSAPAFWRAWAPPPGAVRQRHADPQP
jgi:malate:Na+ symporter